MNPGGSSRTVVCVARGRPTPPPRGEEHHLAQAAILAEELVRAYAAGQRPRTEDLLARIPELATHPALFQVVAEEVRLRREQGPPPSLAEFQGRFPNLTDKLATLFEESGTSQRPGPAPLFPECGEVLAECLLLGELGRGAEGRVFLAKQPLLADRPVVLKVTPCNGAEHLSLARLLHTHIVPLYFVQDVDARQLRVLCMPYLGGATLSQILETLAGTPAAARTGRQIVEALDRVQASSPVPVPAAGPARAYLSRCSYVEAVCWLGACLADALQFAHERELIHLDIKPSNVLLASSGQPLLLDFHLARAPLPAGSPPPMHFGGTNKYMPPEQRQALSAVGQVRPLPTRVDGRADIYSLGKLLCEMLGGSSWGKLAACPTSELRQFNPNVSQGLADILRRCLEDSPERRYPDAASLAADLRNHLANRPLAGVPNRNRQERWRKWRKRAPHALGRLLLRSAAIVGVVCGLALGVLRLDGQQREASSALAEGRALLARGEYGEAEICFRRGLARLEYQPWGSSLARDLAAAQDLTEKRLERDKEVQSSVRLAREFHRLADDLRFSWDLDALSREREQALESRCARLWPQRHHLREQLQASESVRTDLLDLAVLWAEMRARAVPRGDPAREDVLRTLDEAEQLLGRDSSLTQARRALEQFPAEPVAWQPHTPWELYVRGRELLRQGQTEQALGSFSDALQGDPGNFWANFYQGVCAYRLRHFEEAVTAFRCCLALTQPPSAVCYYNRALALDGLARPAEALADYDQALRLDPALSPAWLNRGLLHFRQKRLEQAAGDLDRALDLGADPAQVHYNLALLEKARHNREAAREHVRLALERRPDYAAALELRARLAER